MTISTFGFALMTMASVGACLRQDLASPADPPLLGPLRIVAEEPGVLPTGSSLVVQTDDAVTAVRAMRATIYSANVAEDVVDQNGTLLIPKDSPVELGVRSLSYLGPGGAGMTELILELRAVTVKGVRYPVATVFGPPGAGGLGLERNAPKWVGGRAAKGEVLTSGPRINVPAKTLLAFQIVEPIRLTGFRR
jgi:hypothetical protein